MRSPYAHEIRNRGGLRLFNSLTLGLYQGDGRDLKVWRSLEEGREAEEDEPGSVSAFRAASFVASGDVSDCLANSRLLRMRRALHSRPFRVGFLRVSITDDCNMACPHCLQPEEVGPRSTISEKRLESVFSWFIEQNQGRSPSVQYFGGEPLLHVERLRLGDALLREAIEKGRLIHCRQSVTTNGTLLGRDTARFLVSRGFDVTFSLDGWRETNDRHRVFPDGSGTFDAAMQGVETFRNAGGAASVLVTVHPGTVRQLPGIIARFAREELFTSIGINAPQPTAEGWEVDGIELAVAIQQAWSICQEARVPFHGPGTFIPQVVNNRRPSVDRCIDATPQEDVADWPLYVSPDGRISYCLVHHHDRWCGQAAIPPQPHGIREWHLSTHRNSACDQCIACLICGGPCSLELLLGNGRLNPDRCAFYKKMVPWVLDR